MRTLFLIHALLCVQILSAQNGSVLLGMNTDTAWFKCIKPEFNSKVSDFAATPYDQGYVFSSGRSDDLAVRFFSADRDNPLLDLYYVRKTRSGEFSHPVAFSEALNTRSYNEGPVTFSSDHQAAIYTGNARNKNTLTLLQSLRVKGKWTEAGALAFCGPDFNYVHPSFASGDSVLFFASDCPGGFGGMDIYYVYKVGSNWSQPINAGRKINSPYNELFPFCSATGVLYFSSNRSGGSGGLDILAIAIADTAYSTVQRLSYPINSSADDFAFYVNATNTEGFFSSNRGNEKADDDIYYFTYSWPAADRQDTIVPVELCYDFFEEATVRNGDTAKMKYTWNFSDGTVHYGYELKKCFDTTGEYSILLTVRDSSGGDVIISETNYEFSIAQPNYMNINSPDSIKQHQLFTIGTAVIDPKQYELLSAYYDLDNGTTGTGIVLTHAYHRTGVYYPRIYLLLKNKETGATESRCVVKKTVVN